MNLCNEKPCRYYLPTYPKFPLIEIWSDHLHDGSTDVYLYEIVNDIVIPKNYPARTCDLENRIGYIGDVGYMWYSCNISNHPDPRKRFGLRFGFQKVKGGGYIYVTYDKIVCEDIIEYIRKSLRIKKSNIKTTLDRQVTLFFEKRKKMPNRLIGVKYLQD